MLYITLSAAARDTWASLQDNSNVGIRSTLSRLDSLMEDADAELWEHLHTKNQVLLAHAMLSLARRKATSRSHVLPCVRHAVTGWICCVLYIQPFVHSPSERIYQLHIKWQDSPVG